MPSSQALSEGIAIVALGGVFPGASSLDEFWRNIVNGVDTAREVPEGRWSLASEEVVVAGGPQPDKVFTNRGCFLDEIHLDAFDLRIDKELLRQLDPVFTLTLAAGSQAWRNARTESVSPDRVGVVLGNIVLPTVASSKLAEELFEEVYKQRLFGKSSDRQRNKRASLNRYVAGLPGGLLARALGLGGGSRTLDAACASSLYAIDYAVRELREHRADAMLAGGVSRPDPLYTQMGFSQLHALSPTGRCAPFDATANGLVVGEGAGIVVLKRLSDALRDGDAIHGVIAAIGLSNDVEGNLLQPSTEGQQRALRSAYAKSGWQPSQIDLIECHGTGTPVGDAVEFRSLCELWQGERVRKHLCVIGSVKSNVGHLLTGAGAAGLFKVLLALRHQTLPPTANYRSPNPRLSMETSPFTVLSAAREWESAGPRRAAVNGFGFGGINAHLLIEEWTGVSKVQVQGYEPPASRPIAIVGMDARFGTLETLRDFQECVLGGSSIEPNTVARHWGGDFAAALCGDEADLPIYGLPPLAISKDRFRIPPLELEEMLPQQLLMLEVASRALAHSKIDADRQARKRFGVYMGIGLDLNTTHFHFRWALANKAREWGAELGLDAAEIERWCQELRDGASPALTANRTMGALGGIVASRVARELRVGGPSFTISSEETSGFAALEAAVRALQAQEIDVAIVGAVDINGDPRSLLSTDNCRPYSRSGRCRPFSRAADGTVAGEGAAAIILRRLEDAEVAGDEIHAVLTGIGSATSTAANGMGVDAEAYRSAVEKACADAGIEPDAIGYVETHGSGAPAEDTVELEALAKLFYGCKAKPALGSVKTRIGHAGAAAGMAALVKGILSLKHEILAPFETEEPRPEVNRFLLPQQPSYWLHDRDAGPRRLGVSGMSIDGSCAHVVLEEYPRPLETPGFASLPLGPAKEAVFLIPGQDLQGCRHALDRLEEGANARGDSLDTLARRWWREVSGEKRYRVGLLSRTVDDLRKHIRAAREWLESKPQQSAPPLTSAGGWCHSPAPLADEGSLAFVYPGSGTHFLGMGRDLVAAWPEVLRRQDQENQRLRSQLLPESFWHAESLADAESDLRKLILGQVALGTLVTDAVSLFGIRPQAVIGYSLGESAGLFSLRAWRDRDEMWRRVWESTLFTEDLTGVCKSARQQLGLRADQPFEWQVGVIDRPAEIIRERLVPATYLLLVNTDRECVIGGERDALMSLVRDLGGNFVPLRGVTTVHCELAFPCQKAYRDLHVLPTTPPAGIRFYGGVKGGDYELSSESAADSIIAGALGLIDYPALIRQAYADGIRIFVEMGPGNSCARMIGQILSGQPHFAKSACPQNGSSVTAVLQLLAGLAAEGVAINLDFLYGAEERQTRQNFATDVVTIPVVPRSFQIPAAPKRKSPPLREQPTSPPEILRKPAMPRVPAMTPAGMDVSFSHADVTPSQALVLASGAAAEAHDVFLRLSTQSAAAMTSLVTYQTELLRRLAEAGETVAIPSTPAIPLPAPETYETQSVFMNRAQCLTFALGRIGDVLGEDFAAIDAFPTRVRLPDEPLMLVDRIVEVEGEPRSLSHGRVVTEHDVLEDGWYLDGGRIPTCIAVEAGQADLFLSGYLGIDFETKGEAVYRLLDAVVTFHRELPVPGDVIRYDIAIERFFRQGDTYLFRFHFEGTVNGEPLLTMRDGCAGFFTQEELEAGKGIVQTELARRPIAGKRPADWRDLVPMTLESYSEAQIDCLRRGDLVGAFGAQFANLDLRSPLRLPAGRMSLIDRVVHLDPKGGRFGLGLIRAEADIHPDDWFLTCHFIDDQVMPGTLMYECCLHTLRVFLMRMGWIGEASQVVCQPVPGVASQLKCRGQVLASTRKATYEISIKEIGYRPEPYVIVDALMYSDAKAIVEITNMSLRMTGLDRETLDAMWFATLQRDPGAAAKKPPIYDYEQILAFAIGKPSEAFGDRYQVFDEERIIARLPGPPYQFLDRITAVEGEPWKMAAGAFAEGQYDVPPDAWYFEAARQPLMPFAVLLEVALQPCGWLAAYCGSALTSPVDLSFRNLGGSAVQYLPIGPDAGTLTMTSRMTRVSSSGGMIIQNFDFEVWRGKQLAYKGDTYFGFFSKQALADQVGIRDANRYEPSPADLTIATGRVYPSDFPYPAPMLRMVDDIEIYLPAGGPAGLGYIRGIKRVDPEEWFFKAHFYQDPVCPGSLGLESFLQLIQFAGNERWGIELEKSEPWFWSPRFDTKHRWSYRGQVIPTNRQVTVEAWITAVDDATRTITADGFLLADGKPIYQMNDFSLQRSANPTAKAREGS